MQLFVAGVIGFSYFYSAFVSDMGFYCQLQIIDLLFFVTLLKTFQFALTCHLLSASNCVFLPNCHTQI